MNKSNFAIGFLTATAIAMFIACFVASPQRANGDFAISNRDYHAVTVRLQTGGDALFITDNRTDQIAVFAWDPNKRAVALKVIGPIGNLFLEN